jgi:hypothetical protein
MTKFEDLKIYILRFTYLSFLCTQNYKVFEIDILHICGINYYLHLDVFHILRTCKYDFQFLKNNEITDSKEPKKSPLDLGNCAGHASG